MVVVDEEIERDWLAGMTEQREIANIKMNVVTTMLTDQDASLDTVSKLYRDVEEKARQFDATFLAMSDALGLEHPLIDEALAIEEMWSIMSVSVASRLGVMRAVSPIELANEENDAEQPGHAANHWIT
ncbi:hypothetical protein IHQ71_30765 (plasmid) [Rhizobium sp. TH2]|uniref:hypothetical protein n=1 Tax=Rhizobium sp. TH2 TaxID=2775403 RepID=UPI00215742B1|nr:hypothetical protein [Rhizobium sp. TH2]UVC12388.1 hypothetical protein IHQ71_30765 [Rhizobium sp. TH2]